MTDYRTQRSGAANTTTVTTVRGGGNCYFSSLIIPSNKLDTNIVGYVRTFHAWLSDAGAADDYRVAIYEGGADEDTITNATLLWQSDRLGPAPNTSWVNIGVPSGAAKLTGGNRYWFCIQLDTNTNTHTVTSPNNGDFATGAFQWDSAKGYLANGFPATAVAADSTVNATHSVKAAVSFDVVENLLTKPITIRVPWTKQPPAGTKIDWQNSLTRGLVGLFKARPGLLENLVTNWRLSLAGTANNGFYVTDKGGGFTTVGVADSNPHGIDTDLTTDDIVPQGSIVGIHSHYNSGQVWAFIAEAGQDGLGFRFAANYTNDNIYLEVNGSNGIHTDAIVGYSFGEAYATWSASWDTVADTQDVYTRDGKFSRTDSITNPTTYDIKLGTDVLGGTLDTDVIHFVAFWNRVLSHVEHEAFQQNPWQIFKPRTILAGDSSSEFNLVNF